MKYCPLCESQYTDETLRFCLQDGTPLTTDIKQSAIETVAFSNPVTLEKLQQTEEMRVQFADKTQPRIEPSVVNPVFQLDKIKHKSSSRFWIAVLPILVIFGAAGFGGWFYLNQQNEAAKQNFNDKVILPNSSEKTLPVANTSIVSAETISENTTQPASKPDNSGVKKELSDFITSWKTAFESRNIAEYTAKYAEKVDYLGKTGADIKEIRGEAEKTFKNYTEIEIALTNVHIAVTAEGDKATAVFDKESSYETEKELNETKVHTKLQFEKIGNEWKIISEKNVKTYFAEN